MCALVPLHCPVHSSFHLRNCDVDTAAFHGNANRCAASIAAARTRPGQFAAAGQGAGSAAGVRGTAVRRTFIDRGPARPGQDHPRPCDGLQPGAGLPARAVHLRPAAGRCAGRVRLRRRLAAVPVPSRPGVHQRAAGRRNQPGSAAYAELAAGSDGRAAGDAGWRDACIAGAVLRDCHAEPGRSVGHLPAARLAAGPLPAAAEPGLPQRRCRACAAVGHGSARTDRPGRPAIERRRRGRAARGGQPSPYQRCADRLCAGLVAA